MPDIFRGLIIPFIGTTAGAAMVFLMKGKINQKIEKLLLGFASGVMVAASVWSLLIPSIEMSKDLQLEFIPAAAGFLRRTAAGLSGSPGAGGRRAGGRAVRAGRRGQKRAGIKR